MFREAIRILGGPRTSDSGDAAVISKFLYVAGVVIFLLSTLKITTLHLTEAQLVLGLLVTICVMMQFFVCGLLMEIHSRLKGKEEDNR